jgi:hypothetical protein
MTFDALYEIIREEIGLSDHSTRSPNFKNDITNPKNFVYHATNRKNLKSIMQYGLMPMVGEMVQTFYGDEEQEELTDLVFFSDTPKLHYASAPFNKSTLNDVVLCLVHKVDNDLMQWDGDHFLNYKKEIVDEDTFYPQVETNDWISTENVWPDYVLFDSQLATFLRKFFPRLAKFTGH